MNVSKANSRDTNTGHSAIPVGIDLGTTFSAIAYMKGSGDIHLIPNTDGDIFTPSAVMADPADILIGKEAFKTSVIRPDCYADCFKRSIGVDEEKNELNGVTVPAEVLSALILENLKDQAAALLGEISKVVITVPAFFDETRRMATIKAAKLAGLEVIGIINEPTAAAIAFNHALTESGHNSSRLSRVFVYDLGGGTFDVSIVELDGNRIEVVATDGDILLGGKDIDRLIVDYLADQFLDQHGLDPRADSEDCMQLWLDAEEIKKSLSSRSSTSTVVNHNGLRCRVNVTREVFDGLCLPLISRTELTCELVLRSAALEWSDIDHLLLVGGSSRIPLVRERLESISGMKVKQNISPDSAVASGAVLYAQSLLNKEESTSSLEVVDVNSHSLGVIGTNSKTNRKQVVPLIKKNTPLPAHAEKRFVTERDGQKEILVQVVEGESEIPRNCIPVGQCRVTDLPPALPKSTELFIRFNYDVNGTLAVNVNVPAARRAAFAEIVRQSNTDLASLESWKSQILSGGATLSKGPLTAKVVTGVKNQNELPVATANSNLMMDLEALYKRLGIAASKHNSAALPYEVKLRYNQCQAELNIARSKLEGYIVQTSSKEPRVAQSTNMAVLKQRVAELESQYESIIIEFGKLAFREALEIPGTEDVITACEALLREINNRG